MIDFPPNEEIGYEFPLLFEFQIRYKKFFGRLLKAFKSTLRFQGHQYLEGNS